MHLITALAVLALVLAVFRKPISAVMTVAVAIMLAPNIALAVDNPVDPSDTVASLRLDAVAVAFLVSALIPIVNGLITKCTLSSMWKGLITLILNAVNALVVTATMSDGTAIISSTTFVTFILGLVISVGTYLGVYKNVGLTSSATPAGVPDPKLGPNTGLG
jgi:hypothetical protein